MILKSYNKYLVIQCLVHSHVKYIAIDSCGDQYLLTQVIFTVVLILKHHWRCLFAQYWNFIRANTEKQYIFLTVNINIKPVKNVTHISVLVYHCNGVL